MTMNRKETCAYKPIALDAAKLNVLVVGYGTVGKKKAIAYRDAGATVSTVDPDDSTGATFKMSFDSYYGQHKTHFLTQHLIVIATDSACINLEVETVCSEHYKLFSRTDDAKRGIFHDVATLYTPNYFIAAGSGGQAPQIGPYILKTLQSGATVDDAFVESLIMKHRKAKHE